jgi:hypothetical protein
LKSPKKNGSRLVESGHTTVIDFSQSRASASQPRNRKVYSKGYKG